MLTKEIERSSRIDDEVVQDQRQRDDINLQYKRQDQPKEEEVEPRRSKRARIEKSFRPDFVSFMVENEPTSYREAALNQRFSRESSNGNVTNALKGNEFLRKENLTHVDLEFPLPRLGS
ncbi:hypothetical protein Tco_0156282 [Tanacetum coccineum]